MIMKVPLYIYVLKGSGNKDRRCDGHFRKSRKFKYRDGSLVLVFIHFYDLYLVAAASVRLVDIHTALAAFCAFSAKKSSGCQPVHAIMKIDHDTAGDRKVDDSQYGDDDLLHEQYKDNRNPEFSITS